MSRFLPNLPLAILVCSLLISIYEVSTGPVLFTHRHYLGMTLVLMAVVTAPLGPYFSKAITLLALLLGTFGHAAFTAAVTMHGVALGEMKLEVQLNCLLLLIAFLALNWHLIKTLWSKIPR